MNYQIEMLTVYAMVDFKFALINLEAETIKTLEES